MRAVFVNNEGQRKRMEENIHGRPSTLESVARLNWEAQSESILNVASKP